MCSAGERVRHGPASCGEVIWFVIREVVEALSYVTIKALGLAEPII